MGRPGATLGPYEVRVRTGAIGPRPLGVVDDSARRRGEAGLTSYGVADGGLTVTVTVTGVTKTVSSATAWIS